MPPRSRLVWLQIADQQYHDLPDDLRGLVDHRIAQMLENPTVDADAVYNERSDQWSVPLASAGSCSTPSSATRPRSSSCGWSASRRAAPAMRASDGA
jgi:hypothetical protein